MTKYPDLKLVDYGFVYYKDPLFPLDDISWFLETGFLPDGDIASGMMAEIVETATSQLTTGDRQAIATFLKSLRPIKNPSLERETENAEENW